jgi:chaperonin GroES
VHAQRAAAGPLERAELTRAPSGQSATFKSIRSLQPLFDRVLVQRFKAETKTATGIFLPSSATANPLPEATVIAVGPGAQGKVSRVHG